MAYSDALDLHNADRCLLAVIEPMTTSGSAASRLRISERQVESAPAFAPSDSGDYRHSGIIDAWGEFGYVTGTVPAELRISDGSILCRNDKPFGPFGTFADLLVDYELHGANIWIGQMLTEIVSGVETSRSSLIFAGVISNIGDMGRRTVELSFTDLMVATPLIPEQVVSKVEFPQAPDISIGRSIPLVLGDFEEAACPYSGLNEEDMQEAGHGNLVGLPSVIIDEHLDTNIRGPDFRLMAHDCHNIDADAGAMLLEPESVLPGRLHPDDWVSASASGYCEVRTDWPLRVLLPVLPKDYTYVASVSYPLRAVDGDLETYAFGSGSLRVRSNSVSPMGFITKMEARIWLKAGGSSVCEIYINKNGSGYGSTASVPITGSEQICSLNCLIPGAPLQPWPGDEWNLADYEICTYNSGAGTSYIRQMWWVVTYYPNRRPDGPTRTHKGLFSKPGGRRYSVAKEEPWSETEKNSVVLGYLSGKEDDASGTYTGTSNALIERGADQIYYLAGEHCGLGSSGVELGSGVGRISMSRGELGSYHKLSTYISERQEGGRYLERMCQECRAIPTWNTDGKWGIVVISGDPVVDYRASHAAYDFEPDRDFYRDSFRCWRTPLEELASSVVVDFDYSHVLGKFRKSAFINSDDTDNGFGTDDDSARKTLAGYAEDRFGSGREYKLQAYDVRNQGVAKSLRNFYFDNLWRPRTWFEFETGLNVSDMSVGNIIRFGVETIQGMHVPNPDATNENWDDYLWYVSGVTRLEQDGDVSRYLVRAFEAIIPTTSSDWVAAADDT